MCVILVTLFAILTCYVLLQKASSDNQAKEAKDNVEIYTTDNRRIPQNLMSASKIKWLSVQDRVVKYTMYPLLRGDLFLGDIIPEIEMNTCMRFEYVQTNVSSEAENNNTICYLPDISRLQRKERIHRYGFQLLFRCLGKFLEHQRKDRDHYIHILSENILPEYHSKFKYAEHTVTQGLPYDFDSIMQLKHNAYSKNGNSTIVPMNDTIRKEIWGQSIYPSQQDYLDIWLTYCGTETAAGPVTIVEVGTTSIRVKWPKPMYSPIRIRLDYQYSLLCGQQPYFTQRTYLSVDYAGVDFNDMEPGSLCKLNFAVIYNPSELDRGVNYVFETLPSKPTRPPENVKLLWINGTSAKLSWNAILCPDQHGETLQYIVRHKYELPDETFAVQKHETLSNASETTLRNLRPNKLYFASVAGVNQAGVGAFSIPIMIRTPRVGPGKVRIASIEATYHKITIQWIAPLDEDDIPCSVKLQFSYKDEERTKNSSIVAPSTKTRLTVKNVPSDTSVKFSLAAIKNQLLTGPSIHTTIKTRRIGGDTQSMWEYEN